MKKKSIKIIIFLVAITFIAMTSCLAISKVSSFEASEKIVVTFETNSDIKIKPKITYTGFVKNPNITPDKWEMHVILTGIRKGAYLEWYKDYNFTEKWDFENDKATSDITLFANWIDVKSTTEPSVWSREYVKDAFGDKTDKTYISYNKPIKGTYSSKHYKNQSIYLDIKSFITYSGETAISFDLNSSKGVLNEISEITMFKKTKLAFCYIQAKSNNVIYNSYNNVFDTENQKILIYETVDTNLFIPFYLEQNLKIVITLYDFNSNVKGIISIPEFKTTGYANKFNEL
jgi:hypothetical protein